MASHVTLFADRNFEGRRLRIELDNKRDARLYPLAAGLADRLSSLRWRLPPGRELTFFENRDGTGRRYRIRGAGADPDTHHANFEDCASSWRMVRDDSVPAAFGAVPGTAQHFAFTRAGVRVPSGGHMQGVAQLDHRHLVVSGSSRRTAYFFVVRWPDAIRASTPGQIVRLVEINRDFPGMKHNHASGIQLLGDVLAVGTEGGGDRRRSSVVFYDLSTPTAPRPVGPRLDRDHDTAGAVALVERAHDVVLAVGGWDSGRVDFYRSNGRPLASDGCRFRPVKAWQWHGASTTGWVDRHWTAGQGLNLVRDRDDQLYLIGFTRGDGGHDWADLYQVDLAAGATRMLRKIDKKHVHCSGGASFVHGAGLFAPSPSRHVTLWAVERDVHELTTLNCF